MTSVDSTQGAGNILTLRVDDDRVPLSCFAKNALRNRVRGADGGVPRVADVLALDEERLKFIPGIGPAARREIARLRDSLSINEHWRCFHCDEVFTNRIDAAEHFGIDEGATAACRLTAEQDDLVRFIRSQELDIRRLQRAVSQESGEACRLVESMRSRHANELRQAEELGFGRAVAEMQRLCRAQFGAEVTL